MKKIVFCLQTMVLGGVEKELITILKRFNPAEYNITVCLLYVEDKNIVSLIPDYVKVISLDIDKDYYCSDLASLCRQRLKRGKVFEAASLVAKRLLRIGNSHTNTDISAISSLDGHYDIAVCYHIHSPLSLKYVAEKISADKKIAWIHNDFVTSGYQINRLNPFLAEYDSFVAVSQSVCDEFCALCPKFASKASVANNIIDEEEIIRLAKDFNQQEYFFTDARIKLLTVGRFVDQKGFDIAVEASRALDEKGLDFCWYMIGWGPDEQKIKDMINAYHLENKMIILGKKDNPYPYIDKCDIYAQPSRHEAWGLVVQEARALCKPIICTDFAGSDEQIISGETGYIVPAGSVDKLADALSALIGSGDDRERLSQNLAKQLNSNSDFLKILEKFGE